MQAQSQSSTYKSNQGWFFAQLGCFIHPLFLLCFCSVFARSDGWVPPPALRPQVVRLTLGCHQHNDISQPASRQHLITPGTPHTSSTWSRTCITLLQHMSCNKSNLWNIDIDTTFPLWHESKLVAKYRNIF